jgi:hypothetical protein
MLSVFCITSGKNQTSKKERSVAMKPRSLKSNLGLLVLLVAGLVYAATCEAGSQKYLPLTAEAFAQKVGTISSSANYPVKVKFAPPKPGEIGLLGTMGDNAAVIVDRDQKDGKAKSISLIMDKEKFLSKAPEERVLAAIFITALCPESEKWERLQVYEKLTSNDIVGGGYAVLDGVLFKRTPFPQQGGVFVSAEPAK